MLFFIGLRDQQAEYILGDAEVAPLDTLKPAKAVPDDPLSYPSWLAATAYHLFAWFSEVEQKLISDAEKLGNFYSFLSDTNLYSGGYSAFVHPANRAKDETSDQRTWLVWAAFYRALCFFLRDADRYLRLDARLLYLYSAWQWYNLVKRLAEENPMAFHEELALAYRMTSTLLEDYRFSTAALWLARWHRADVGPDLLVRDRMRLSMILINSGSPEKVVNIRKPLAAPGAFTFSPPHWSETQLHPVFAPPQPGDDEDLRDLKMIAGRAVRRLISERIIPRYDFLTALHLARLLKKNQPDPTFPRKTLVRLLIASVVWLGLIVGATISFKQANLGIYDVIWSVGGAIVLSLFGAILLGWPVFYLDLGVLPHLMLPRLMGGVALGYAALVLDSSAVQVARAFVTRLCFPVVLALIAVMIIGFGYLYFDITPLVIDRDEARKRAGIILLLALAITVAAGLLAAAITTAAYYDPQNPPKISFLGPFGWVDFHQWFSFIPMALITGLVTQFLFEERTVTAPVWAPEES